MNPDHCLLERDGHVLTVTLNRPEAKYALSAGMLAGMYRAWRMLDGDPELRVAILTGRGDVFCAGADLKAMGAGESDDEFMQLMSRGARTLLESMTREEFCGRVIQVVVGGGFSLSP